MELIDRILMLMQKQNLSKADLHRLSGLKKSTFYNLFDEKTNPDKIQLDTIRAIADALNTTLDYLMTGKDTQTVMGSFSAHTIISIGRGGKRTIYNMSDEDAAIVDNLLERLSKKKE